MTIRNTHNTNKLVKGWFASQVHIMSWPSQSSDLNRIENIWDEIDGKTHAKILSNNKWREMKISNVTLHMSVWVYRKFNFKLR